MIIATRYTKIQDGDYYRILNEDIPVCPQCGTVLSGYDNRKRHAIDDFGNKQWYRLRRLKCRPCKKLHLEIPDFIQPQKHYEKGVISNALSGNTCSCPADDSTIRRWKSENNPPGLPVSCNSTMVVLSQNQQGEGELD